MSKNDLTTSSRSARRLINNASDALEKLKRQEREYRAAAERSSDDTDRQVHEELARLTYGRRKWIEATS